MCGRCWRIFLGRCGAGARGRIVDPERVVLKREIGLGLGNWFMAILAREGRRVTQSPRVDERVAMERSTDCDWCFRQFSRWMRGGGDRL